MANALGIVATSDAFEIQKSLMGMGTDAGLHADSVIIAAATAIRDQIRANASHAPWGAGLSPNKGPAIQNKQDPNYVASWGVTHFFSLTNPTAVIGTDYPQGRRLEWGFVGTDSLGRHYNQRPFPHVGPAIDRYEPLIGPALLEAVSSSYDRLAGTTAVFPKGTG